MKLVSVLFLITFGTNYFPFVNTNEMMNNKDFIVLVVVSSSSHLKDGGSKSTNIYNSVAEWERGEEILPGAHVAIDEINNGSEFLPTGYRLKMEEVRVVDCDVNTALIHYVDSLVASKKLIGIVGYFCNNIADVFSSLITPKRSGYTVQISASTDYLPSESGYQHHLLPSMTATANAVISFLNTIGWSRFGVLKTAGHPGNYYSRLAETFTEAIDTDKIIYKSQIDNVKKAVKLTKLRYSGTKVIVGFLTPSDASKTICQAHLEGLVWPDYVWILVDVTLNDLLTYQNSVCDIKMLKLALEKVIFIHHYPLFTSEDKFLTSGLSYSEYYHNTRSYTNSMAVLYENNYRNLLYDSIWALGKALNSTLEKNTFKALSQDGDVRWKDETIILTIEHELSLLSFDGATGFVNFSQTPAIQVPFGIFQYQKHELVKLGLYCTSLNKITSLNRSLLGTVPTDELESMFEIYPTYLTVGLSLVICLCILFTSVILIFFFYFRAEPEIKAASRNLTLCMFLGCYTLLFASLDYTILSGVVIPVSNTIVSSVACVMDITLSAVGLDLILATLFAKMLRVYHIFKKFGKVSTFWSDKGLFVLIVITVLIEVTLLVIWTAVDINHVVNVKIYEQDALPPYYRVIQKCDCMYFGVWYALTFLYTGFLFLALLLVATFTRKIKCTNFKDTKKVNLLIATLSGVIIFSCTGWAILQFIDNNASKVIVSVSFALTSILCQSFLLVPKIIPPIRRSFENTFIESTTISTLVSYH